MNRGCVAFVIGLAFATEARADLPGPRPTCDTEGMSCESCWSSYGGEEKDKAAFEACAAPLRAKGLTEGCRHRQGAGLGKRGQGACG